MILISKKKNTSATGQLGESIACLFLERKGFTIIERNYRKPWGEIDIIAQKDHVYRFIEVKSLSRENSRISEVRESYRPEEQVHSIKLKKIARTAETYMAEKGGGIDFQIDVIGVFLDARSRKATCRLYEQVL